MKRVVVALLVFLLAACAGMPTSGAPQEVERPSNPNGGVVIDPKGPTPGADPEALVNDFLRAAGAGLSGDFSVARQFLTKEAAERWKPTTEVRVYQDHQNPSFSQNRSGGIKLSAPAEATVDESGMYTAAATDAQVTAEFSLVRDESGEWRIAVLEDGVIVPQSIFYSLYTETELYFLTADRSALVPEARWYPNARAANYAVQGLLAGPSQWLSPGAHTVSPVGTTLTDRGVTTTDGVAHVDLSPEVSTLAHPDLVLLDAQISRTLQSLPGVQNVVITAGGSELDVGARVELPTYPYGTYTLVGLYDGVPAGVTTNGVNLSPNTQAGQLGLTDLARPYAEPVQMVVGLGAGGTAIYRVPFADQRATTLLTGKNLIRPSIDSYDWVWSGETQAQGVLQAVNMTSGEQTTMKVPWLDGVTVHDIAVSREGSRIVLVTQQSGQTRVQVAAVVRGEGGQPKELGEPITIGPRFSEVTDVTWISEVRLAVIGRQGTSGNLGVHVTGIGVQTTSVTTADEVVRLTGGRGVSSLVLQNASNSVLSYDGAGWRPLADDVTAPAYPG